MGFLCRFGSSAVLQAVAAEVALEEASVVLPEASAVFPVEAAASAEAAPVEASNKLLQKYLRYGIMMSVI